MKINVNTIIGIFLVLLIVNLMMGRSAIQDIIGGVSEEIFGEESPLPAPTQPNFSSSNEIANLRDAGRPLSRYAVPSPPPTQPQPPTRPQPPTQPLPEECSPSVSPPCANRPCGDPLPDRCPPPERPCGDPSNRPCPPTPRPRPTHWPEPIPGAW